MTSEFVFRRTSIHVQNTNMWCLKISRVECWSVLEAERFYLDLDRLKILSSFTRSKGVLMKDLFMSPSMIHNVLTNSSRSIQCMVKTASRFIRGYRNNRTRSSDSRRSGLGQKSSTSWDLVRGLKSASGYRSRDVCFRK